MKEKLSSLKLGKNKKTAFLLLALLVIPLAVAGVAKYQNKNPQVLAANEMREIVAEVGKITDLPVGEEPTVATVSDVTKLSGQEFFAKAANGDKVLIYSKAQKAILYRPSTKKLIEVAFYNPPVTTPAPVQSEGALSPSPQVPTPTIGISLRDLIKESPTPTKAPDISVTAVPSSPTPTP